MSKFYWYWVGVATMIAFGLWTGDFKVGYEDPARFLDEIEVTQGFYTGCVGIVIAPNPQFKGYYQVGLQCGAQQLQTLIPRREFQTMKEVLQLGP
jgi:hypothetical protein